jgi:hypothetical protein
MYIMIAYIPIKFIWVYSSWYDLYIGERKE